MASAISKQFVLRRLKVCHSVSWSKIQCIRGCHSTAQVSDDYDVVISGGGMVGTGLLCALGSNAILKNKRVLLLEKQKYLPPKELPPTYSNRVVALNPSSVQLLTDLDVWPDILSKRAKKINNMQVWESCSESYISFKKDSHDGEIAYIVENDVILTALSNRLEAMKSDNLSVKYEANIIDYDLSSDEENVKINLDNGRVINTSLLIGADGAVSQVRNKMEVDYLQQSYNQSAIVATLKLSEECENDTAWQRFLPTGPVALLPLNNELTSLVWTNSKVECHRLLRMDDEQFVDALNQAIWDDSKKSEFVESATNVMAGLLSTFTPAPDRQSVLQLPPGIMSVVEKSRASFPLSVGHASNYVTRNVALIGDAAHKVHPLAGQGLNLGFGDIKCLVDTLAEAVYNGALINDIEYLRQYESMRQKHVVPTVLAIHGLKYLYGTDFAPVVLLRSLGLQITNSLPFLKSRIMNHASG